MIETAKTEAPARPDGLQPVERSYQQVIRVRTLLAWLPVVIGAVVLDRLVLAHTPVGGLLLVAAPLLALLTAVTAPPRIWGRLGYALEPAMLRVVRGWLFHIDTLVPLVRVQHLDVARGPLDKMFGTATLAIHTAGTHNSIVSLPGLSPARAAELAAAIRTHIKADLD
ncbi:PH domain-containing protein [Sphingomonas glaciei]|uniref:PH domain-containing protein n=1 Tax=Sphingomonas glaciei TaxID=2938948 RepID=A0ABY5MR21_9SPHN|nr:PH domain-containing protein [Sphingomonas glaciei]UUR06935.1 PH domain-containing protein [Sphingomonas glaciei]